MGKRTIYKLESFAMNIQNLNVRVADKILSQAGNINIHAPCVKVIVIGPDRS